MYVYWGGIACGIEHNYGVNAMSLSSVAAAYKDENSHLDRIGQTGLGLLCTVPTL